MILAFDEFSKYHKNKYNIIFHVICGTIFMTSLFLMTNELLLFVYILLLFLTIGELKITLGIFAILLTMINLLRNYNFGMSSFVIFYFLPELSHYLTSEPTVMTLKDATPLSILVNIFYLLPFSIMCLFKPS